MSVAIRLRRGSAAEWTAANPTLALGEPGWETDTGKLKIGTGSTAWALLPYYVPSSHTHSAADITSGTLDAARIPTSVQGLGAANQVLAASRTVTNNGDGHYLLVNLGSDGKSSILAVSPSNPSLALSINDGAGQAAALQFGSAGIHWTMAGAMDWRINSDPGEAFACLGSKGANTPPVWLPEMPLARFYFADFVDLNVHTNDPFFGTAISGGTQSSTPPSWARGAGTLGSCLMRSSATANSGWRWISGVDRLLGQAGLYFRGRLGIPTNGTNKTIRFGFLDTTSSADAVDGTYFELNGSLVCSAKSAASSSRTTSPTTFTLSANTMYVFEIEWTSTSSVSFRILSADSATTHLDVAITTDLPTTDPQLFGAGIVATHSGTSATDLACVDYLGLGLKGLR